VYFRHFTTTRIQPASGFCQPTPGRLLEDSDHKVRIALKTEAVSNGFVEQQIQ
jgi:hypothetical protein